MNSSPTVSIIKIKVPKTPVYFEKFWSLLSLEEQQRALLFIFSEDRWQYVFCRSTLRLILGDFLNLSPDKIVFSYSNFGKPYLENSKFKFNIAHCRGYFAFAGSFDCEVGIDIEAIKNINPLVLGISCCSSSELQQLRRYREETLQIQAFFTCWTRKEALLKGTGIGIGQGIKQIKNENCFQNEVCFQGSLWTLTTLSDLEHHSWAFACSGGKPNIHDTSYFPFSLG